MEKNRHQANIHEAFPLVDYFKNIAECAAFNDIDTLDNIGAEGKHGRTQDGEHGARGLTG